MKALTGIPKPVQTAVRGSRRASALGSRNGQHRVQTTRVLVPIDFSAASLKALDYALNLAGQTKAKVTLLHVLERLAVPEFAAYPIAPDTERSTEAKTRLTKLAREHGYTSDMVEIRVRSGVPYREITRAAESLKMDLIVIATHGYTGLSHVLMGSTAERVVRYAPCPVLVVPTRK